MPTPKHAPGPQSDVAELREIAQLLIDGDCQQIQRENMAHNLTKIANRLASAPALVEALKRSRADYGRLHDMLSDMIEGGRLTEAEIPDDYQALVAQLVTCNGADDTARQALAQAQAEGPSARGPEELG